ncbi:MULTISPECIES: hypothetical protein [unclassified Caballeronia]|uniref:hypothetical protein n=1 Tax=unclassified Caballeronia TaxID=2646786 RepID=UPI00285B74A7|nr:MULTISPECIES: hypothetical protein [unclassified Caballeronia]MDR5738413.1 hypothetical protein [Caballeronia sp. LZ016]MDR5811732.1 hypothetical protein [Caballeronia sp. LZ019]
MPILADQFEFKLDDEFARRPGVAVFNLMARGQPGLKQLMRATAEPRTLEE